MIDELPRTHTRKVALRVALAFALGLFLGRWGGWLGQGAAIFLTHPCAWHAAQVTGKGSGARDAFVDVRYVRGGASDSITIAGGVYEQARVGQRVWVWQCQQGLGVVVNRALEVTPQHEGPGVPQTSNN